MEKKKRFYVICSLVVICSYWLKIHNEEETENIYQLSSSINSIKEQNKGLSESSEELKNKLEEIDEKTDALSSEMIDVKIKLEEIESRFND